MKIAFLVNEFPSVSQTFVLSQITGLIDRGHEVDIFAEEERRDLSIHEDVKKYHLLERTSYPLTIPHSKLVRVLRGVRYGARVLTKNPFSVIRSLNVLTYGMNAASLTLLYQMMPFLQKGAYDIIHCQFGMLGPKGLLIKRIASPTAKLVTSFRGYDASKYLTDRPGFYDELFREGDLFLPVSQSLKERLIKEGCDDRKIVVFHSGIDCEKFPYAKREVGKGEPTTVVTIGRLVEKKGIEYAIKAMAQLVGSGRNVQYLVIGDGELRGKLESLMKELRLTSHVQLLGWKNHDEVVRLLQHAHILVAPSVTAGNGDQEGIPNVLKEAMALGLPVLSTMHSGIPELVEDGVSGYLVKERDVDALADRLSYLIDHPEIWSTMGRAGRERIQKHYDIKILNNRLVEVYRQ